MKRKATLEDKVYTYLSSQPYSMFGDFNIQQEDRKCEAVVWMCRHMRAIDKMSGKPNDVLTFPGT